MALVTKAMDMLQHALAEPGMGAESEIGKSIIDALKALGKAMPEGSVTPGLERAGMEQYMLQQRQSNPVMNLIAALKQGGGAQPPGAGQPQMPALPQM